MLKREKKAFNQNSTRANLSFKSKREIKTSQDKQKLRKSVTTRPVPQQMIKGVLQDEIRKQYGVTKSHMKR